MGYISGFGTKFVAPTLGLVLLGSAVAASGATSADVTVNITNQRNVKGQFMVCLTANPKAFPDCRKDAKAMKKLAPASAKSLTFNDVAPGRYAVAIVHDENKNNKMDLALFMPKEGFAFSRNPSIGMGPPKFKKAAFDVGNVNITQNVRMKYIF